RETRPSALLAPRAALDLSGKAPRAKVGDEFREVKLGPCNALECVVVSGLEEGTRLSPVVKRDA
ncbi:MAG TPA: hypothetical protein VHK90_05430, partial [Thermoanaerobaculia bacterium]|nr:hypothetical protein [Thermoanaerobaculia bacterium]